jgi:predicted metal-binding protein
LSESKSVSAPQSITIGDIVERAIEMGAEKAKVIDTDSIVVEKWVKWKCVYGSDRIITCNVEK